MGEAALLAANDEPLTAASRLVYVRRGFTRICGSELG